MTDETFYETLSIEMEKLRKEIGAASRRLAVALILSSDMIEGESMVTKQQLSYLMDLCDGEADK